MERQRNKLRIWQWNCRGFKGKRVALQQFIKHAPAKPHVILIQETRQETCTLPGYSAYASAREDGVGLCALVDKRIAVIEHDLTETAPWLEHALIELVPGRFLRANVFLFNVYSNPKDTSKRFATLFNKAINKAGSKPLIVAGDFNARHTAWGYIDTNRKGINLLETSEERNFRLITDPTFPTRLGNSTLRDTTPDLAFVRNVEADWNNTMENLGSDHYILDITVNLDIHIRTYITYTDWESFREKRLESAEPTSLEEWTSSVQEDIKGSIKKVMADQECPRMDSRLAHLFEAKTSILNRWKAHRLHRRLRKKIAELNRTIQNYSAELAQQQWNETCNSVDGQMRAGGKWDLLKALLNDTKSKPNQSRALQKAVHTARQQLSEEQLIQKLANTYLPMGTSTEEDYPEYTGPQKPELDAPFSESEVRYAAHSLRNKSAPGPDGITNTAIRNLDDPSISWLTKEINRTWERGEVPVGWKTAKVVLIPKPGKPPNVDNLRPISLTSCVGKLMEHVVQNRLTRYCEEKTIFPPTMVGFRPSMCTQDVLWLLRQDVLLNNTQDTQAILALDLEKAFDRVKHRHILDSISEAGLGRSFHNYIKSFLSGRTAVLTVGDLQSDQIKLGPRGTPQGAVLSPLLFNLSMLRLSRALDKQPKVKYALYADDITLWCTSGRDSEIEEALQASLRAAEEALAGTGLRCSPSKSELLLFKRRRQGRPPKGTTAQVSPSLEIRTAEGQVIPRVQSVRILGVHFDEGGRNGPIIVKLKNHLTNVTQLINRVANKQKRGGLREHNVVRVIQAFLLSHVAYVASIFTWSLTELDKLDTILRQAVKRALGLPMNTSTSALQKLGVGNTMRELIEAQSTAQMLRLASSSAGRRLLTTQNIQPPPHLALDTPLPKGTTERIYTTPLPKNMHPLNNPRRRELRARALLRSVDERPERASFVDAAKNQEGYVSVTVSPTGQLLNTLSTRAASAPRAEQVAIAMALLDPSRPNVYSDSQAAIRAFASGYVAAEAARLLAGKEITPHTLIWFPGHMGTLERPSPNPNELAHSTARDLSRRAGRPLASEGMEDHEFSDIVTTFHDITLHYQLIRREFPLPHRGLTRPQSSTFRMLQTGSYPSLARLHKMHPDAYAPNCPKCGNPGTLDHMLWQCPFSPHRDLQDQHSWTKLLHSESYDHQLLAVQRAHDAAVELNLPVPTWAAPAP